MPRTKSRPNTRERILDAALDLFVEQGFRGTTISDVERQVGLAAGTGSFYRHFSSKEALLQAAVDREVEQRMAEVEHERASITTPDDPRDQFVAAAEKILRDMHRFDRLFRLMLTEGERVPEVRDAITTALQGSGAVSWMAEPMVMVGVAALMGYHLSELVGGGLLEGVTQAEFIDALATLAEGAGEFSFGPQ